MKFSWIRFARPAAPLVLGILAACGAPDANDVAEQASAVTLDDERSPQCTQLETDGQGNYWNVTGDCYAGTANTGANQIRCPAGQVVSGIYGRAGDYIDRVGTICSVVLPGGNLASPQSTYSVGGNGGGGFDEIDCPTKSGVASHAIGIFGRAGGYVDAMGLVCAYPDGTVARTGTAGGSGGGGYELRCLDNGWMNVLSTFSGSWIDAAGVRCETMINN
jgi:hypothetical protein